MDLNNAEKIKELMQERSMLKNIINSPPQNDMGCDYNRLTAEIKFGHAPLWSCEIISLDEINEIEKNLVAEIKARLRLKLDKIDLQIEEL